MILAELIEQVSNYRSEGFSIIWCRAEEFSEGSNPRLPCSMCWVKKWVKTRGHVRVGFWSQDIPSHRWIPHQFSDETGEQVPCITGFFTGSTGWLPQSRMGLELRQYGVEQQNPRHFEAWLKPRLSRSSVSLPASWKDPKNSWRIPLVNGRLRRQLTSPLMARYGKIWQYNIWQHCPAKDMFFFLRDLTSAWRFWVIGRYPNVWKLGLLAVQVLWELSICTQSSHFYPLHHKLCPKRLAKHLWN